MSDLKNWKDKMFVAEDKACPLEKAPFILNTNKKTKVAAGPQETQAHHQVQPRLQDDILQQDCPSL